MEAGWLAVEGATAWEHRWPGKTESSAGGEGREGITTTSPAEVGGNKSATGTKETGMVGGVGASRRRAYGWAEMHQQWVDGGRRESSA